MISALLKSLKLLAVLLFLVAVYTGTSIFSLSGSEHVEIPTQCDNIARACGSRIVNGMQLGLPLTTLPVKLHHEPAASSRKLDHTFIPSDCRC